MRTNKLICSVLLIAVLCLGLVPIAMGADADLQQYNRTAVNVESVCGADPLTSSLLLVRDGKYITADSNAAGKAPINRSVKQAADYYTCVRCAVFGNCAGVNRRTLKSLDVDGTGGATSAATAGTIRTINGTGYSAVAPGAMDIVKSAGGTVQIRDGKITFVNTSAGGGNPARTAAQTNAVLPLNIPKAWVKLTSPSGVITYGDGYNIAACAVQSNTEIYCDFAVTLDNDQYLVVPTTTLGDTVECFNTTATRTTCTFATSNCNSVPGCKLGFVVYGRLTS